MGVKEIIGFVIDKVSRNEKSKARYVLTALSPLNLKAGHNTYTTYFNINRMCMLGFAHKVY